jgi:hypothetical protein
MRSEVLLGLAKLLEKEAKRARPNVEAGEYDIDTVVQLHISGTLDVAEDEEYVPTVKMPWKAALALTLRYAGITREHAMDSLVRAMQQALQTGESAEELVSALADVEEAEAIVAAGLNELPKQPRAGKVNVKELEIEEVTPAAARKSKRAA